MQQARQAAASSSATGLEAIASAYETWLRDGGMRTLMSEITAHLQTTPTSGEGAERSIPGRTVRAALSDASDRRVIVEIDEVVIDLGPEPAAVNPGPGGGVLASFDLHPSLEWNRELHDRVGDVAAL
jgi:hypothetical protein